MTRVVGSIAKQVVNLPRLKGKIHKVAEVLRGEGWCRGAKNVAVRRWLPVVARPMQMRSRGELGGIVSWHSLRSCGFQSF